MLHAVQALVLDDPAGLLPARNQMALSLGWHIILASFGVAWPAMILVAHWRGVYRRDDVALGLAQRWAKVSAVLFAIGAVSGTVLSFQMGLLWPGLMGRYGGVLGLPPLLPLSAPMLEPLPEHRAAHAEGGHDVADALTVGDAIEDGVLSTGRLDVGLKGREYGSAAHGSYANRALWRVVIRRAYAPR